MHSRLRTLRRLSYALVSVVVAVAFSACEAGRARDASDASDKPIVLTTFTVLADMAQNVAGNYLQVESITKVGAEIHGYEPTPGDIRRAAEADLILDNGLNLEAWFGQFVEGLDVPHVVVSEGVPTMPIAEDAYAGLTNPHAWMSARNGQIYVANMVRAFSDLDPAHAADYQRNGAAYSAELQRIHERLVDQIRTVPKAQRALVTCEGAFSYLTRDTGLREIYIWPVNAEQQATPQRVAATIDAVTRHRVPAVFCESTVSDKPMQQVVRATGASFGGVLYVDSLSAADGPVPTYLDLLRHDAAAIVTGLTAGFPA
jgi:manganese transport system substrate-binding protein